LYSKPRSRRSVVDSFVLVKIKQMMPCQCYNAMIQCISHSVTVQKHPECSHVNENTGS